MLDIAFRTANDLASFWNYPYLTILIDSRCLLLGVSAPTPDPKQTIDHDLQRGRSTLRPHDIKRGSFGRLKNKLFYPWGCKDATIENFIVMLDDYICWYNEKRIKISLGSFNYIESLLSLGLAA